MVQWRTLCSQKATIFQPSLVGYQADGATRILKKRKRQLPGSSLNQILMTEPSVNQTVGFLEETTGQEESTTPDSPDTGALIQDEDIDTAGMKPKRARGWEPWLLFLVAGVIIFLDQTSKNMVESALELFTYWAPFPEFENIFRITHVSNTGVAFGLFQNGNIIFTILAIIVSVGIILYNSRLAPGHKLLRLALGLQMGGALGNMIDRLRQGYVTDFMDFGPWPVWNVADLAIVSGTILLVLIMFYDERQQQKAAASTVTSDDQRAPQTETVSQQIDESSTS